MPWIGQSRNRVQEWECVCAQQKQGDTGFNLLTRCVRIDGGYIDTCSQMSQGILPTYFLKRSSIRLLPLSFLLCRPILITRVIIWYLNLIMKQALRKLQGSPISSPEVGQFHLTSTFREEHCEYDQLYFLTQQEGLVCKAYHLDGTSSEERFKREQEVYREGKFPQLAQLAGTQELQLKKNVFGLLFLKVPRRSLLIDLFSTLAYSEWLDLTQSILDFIGRLQGERQVFLNINPWSIFRDADGAFRVMDVQFLTAEGSYQQISANNSVLIDICENQYRYHSPELLDEYCKSGIDVASDIFSFGIVLYELLYHQYPFDSKLSQINSNFNPNSTESSFFLQLIGQMLRPYGKRASVGQLKAMLESERMKVPKGPGPMSKTVMGNSSASKSKPSGNIFSGLTQMFSKLTTQTQGWFLNFTDNDFNRPEQKYLNLIINKLYKKQTKLDKLVNVILKYIGSDAQCKENQIIKSLLLVLSLLRKGPTTVLNYQWSEVFVMIDAAAGKNIAINELTNFCRQKVAINTTIKQIFRGNFYIDELSKFKTLTIDLLNALYNHLAWVIDSINSKFISSKQDKPVMEYLREIYCDEILDCISMLILSVICIRKDNQLQLRKDNLSQISQIEKKINNLLKKISNLSNYVSAHAIYALQGEFFYYKEEIQLRENPYFTSLEHFYKYCRQYKGLCIPQNYAMTFSSTEPKQFQSNQKNKPERQKSQNFRERSKYFEGADSDGDKNDSFKVLDSPSPQKVRNVKRQRSFQLEKRQKNSQQQQKIKPKVATNIQADKPIKQETKKTVTFDQFFNLQPTKTPINPPSNKPTGQPNFDKIEFVDKNQKKKSDDFTFFQAFMQPPPKLEKPKQNGSDKPSKDFLQLFGLNQKDKQKTIKPLGNSNSQKNIQHNLMDYDWLQKAPLPPLPPKKIEVSHELLNSILSGLKLKELKQTITNNQQIIIEFSKLKLDKVIGSGSAGEVYFGKYQNQNVAIKRVKAKENPNALKQFERQLLTYIKIKRNPYLVSLIGLSKSEEDYYLLTQFCNSGSLFDLLHKRAATTPLSWKQKQQISIQVAKGMLALHQMRPPIIHRDLKSLNVFVIQSNNKFTAKVADFGLSRSPQAEMMTMYLGTLHWMAPELLDNKQYSIKVDVYSYAIVLWEICARKTPYNELSNPMAIVKHVTIEKKRPNMASIPPDCPPPMIELMTQCWAEDPNLRPSFTEIIERLAKIQIFC